MRRIVWMLGLSASSAALVACASILGLDDGTPREDAGPIDATVDVTIDVISSTDATPDVVAPDVGPDVAPDAPKPFSPLSCGSATCNAVTQECCRTGYGDDASPYAYGCVSDAGACKSASAILVGCDRAANCAAQGKPGHICCANVVVGDLATAVTCLAPSACGADAGTIVCGPGDDELCATQAFTCLASNYTIVGWNICK